MGSTTKYALPWPTPGGLLRDGATAIRQLAEAVEAALLPPLLVTDGDGAVTWTAKMGEIPWDVTDNPDRRRGTWDSNTSQERLVIPATPGWYMVTTSAKFGGKSEPDTYELAILTRAVGSGEGTGTVWSIDSRELPANSPNPGSIALTSLVRVADTSPRTGIAVRAKYTGANTPPAMPAGSNKLRAIRVSAL